MPRTSMIAASAARPVVHPLVQLPSRADQRVFQAVFCPRCGECVNEPAEILGAHRAEAANCFWCKRRHSIDQIAVCRQLEHLSDEQRLAGAKAGLLRMHKRLTAKIRGVVLAQLAFDEEECDVLLFLLLEAIERQGDADDREALGHTDQRVQHDRGDALDIPLAVLWSLHTAVSEALTEIKRTQEPPDGLHEGVSPATGDG